MRALMNNRTRQRRAALRDEGVQPEQDQAESPAHSDSSSADGQ